MIIIKRYSFLFFLVVSITACNSTKQTSSQRSQTPKTRKPTEIKASSSVKKVDENVSKVIETARSFTGTPYRWGGTTRAGMDCSGLLMISFQAAGISIPRTSEAQSQIGKKSSLESLQEGDLVFFSAKKGHGKITHVGLVTEVNSKREVKFIHASTKLGVVENNIYSDYYRGIFVKARRPF